MPEFLPSRRIPKYRHYKPKDLAVVRIEGKDSYLGPYGSAQSHEKYRRLIASWLANLPDEAKAAGKDTQSTAASLSIAELLLAYVRFADGYDRKNGRPTKEAENMRQAIRPLRDLYAMTPVREFGPKCLKTVRQAMIEAGHCRNEINRRVRRIARVFKWGFEDELVPSDVHQGLKAVAGLVDLRRPGIGADRGAIREGERQGRGGRIG
ncbi:hypothetical protein AB1L88_21620 [Tautonia sp. JC769]|uniref:hypothetical protein n=1 Tax=Tautonia sp. JC769 TaxID=3232135 RepID=UPI003459E0AD